MVSDVAFHNAIKASLQDAHGVILLFMLYIQCACDSVLPI